MPASSKLARSDLIFSLAFVVKTLKTACVLTDAQADEVLRTHSKKEAVLRNRLKLKHSDRPYISPIEIVAAYAFPSNRPRRETIDEEELCTTFAGRAGVPFVRIDPLKLDARTLCTIVSKPFARRNLLVPIDLAGDLLTVAMVNPFDRSIANSLEDVTGHHVKPVLALRTEILKTINELFTLEHNLLKADQQRSVAPDLGNLEQLVDVASEKEIEASDRHIINAVDLMFQYAYAQRASDIHVEPKRDHALVRFRIDGRLHTTNSLPKRVHPPITSRIKILARMDIAEKRRPQDGRIKTRFAGAEVELRISCVPTAHGEKLVIRIFDPGLLVQDLSGLGFFPDQLRVFERCLTRPHGIILVTGPTGSGKTTTLYSALRFLSNPEVNVTTIEDPIEMVYEAFNQIAVQPQVGVTFSSALRNVLRQDPDIIMVGEIRDRETAEYAVQAALTGHLVLTTLHTNTAAGAITRLRDLGIESFLLASTLISVVAQRLVRNVCLACDEPAVLTEEQRQLLGASAPDSSAALRRGIGCEACRRTGYTGRSAIVEILEVDGRMRSAIRDGGDERELERAARDAGMPALITSAVRLLAAGRTTVEEILRVVPPSETGRHDPRDGSGWHLDAALESPLAAPPTPTTNDE